MEQLELDFNLQADQDQPEQDDVDFLSGIAPACNMEDGICEACQ